jgi:hypothetical protein
VSDQPDDAVAVPAATQPAATHPAATQPAAPEPRQVRLRRAPRYRAFVLTGVMAGVLVALVVSRLTADAPEFSSGSILGYLAVILGLIGGVLGAGVAILVERPRR